MPSRARWVGESATMVPGHGAIAKAADVRRFRTYFTNMHTRVRAAIAAGKTRHQGAIAVLIAGAGANAARPATQPALAALPGARLRGVSNLYRTKPVGVEDQPDFLNAVVALDVPAGPDPATGATALLVALKDLERAFGRERRGRWGPRELDLDLLVFGRRTGAAAITWSTGLANISRVKVRAPIVYEIVVTAVSRSSCRR